MFDQAAYGNMNFIINQRDFVGVFKIISTREVTGFILRLELHRFQKSNQYVLDEIIKQNQINPTDSKLLNKVSCEMVFNTTLSYIEIKQYLNFLKTHIKAMKRDSYNFANLNIMNKITVILDLDQHVQFYYCLDSFYKNYFILESMYNMLSQKITAEEPIKHKLDDEKLTDYVVKQKAIKSNPAEAESIQQTIEAQKQSKPKTKFDELLEYCYDSTLKDLLLHYAVQYYQYIPTDITTVELQDNVYRITTPNILPNALNMDRDYFRNYILQISKTPIETIRTFANKLIKRVLFDDPDTYCKSSLYIMIFNFLMLVYSIRLLNELYPNVLMMDYENILANNKDLQKRIIQHYSNTLMNNPEYKLEYNIVEVNFNDIWEQQKIDVIDEISNEYSHLIPVSQEHFADIVFGKLAESESEIKHHPELVISNKKILDIASLIKRREYNFNNSELLDPEGTISASYSADMERSNYLSYRENADRIISKAFYFITEYHNNPKILKKIDNSFPKEVINLFPVLSSDILTTNVLPKDLDDTFEYYKIVIKHIPRPELLKFTSIMFIIYQIIIPYYYYMHKRVYFKDCLL